LIRRAPIVQNRWGSAQNPAIPCALLCRLRRKQQSRVRHSESHPAKPNPVSSVELRFLSPVGGLILQNRTYSKPPIAHIMCPAVRRARRSRSVGVKRHKHESRARTRDSPGNAQFCISVELRFPQPPRRPLPGRVGQHSIEAASCPELCIQQLGASSFSKPGRLVPQSAKPGETSLRPTRLSPILWLVGGPWSIKAQNSRPPVVRIMRLAVENCRDGRLISAVNLREVL
jgi:hypothetical protein